MSKRQDTIGIKQVIRYEWMEKTCNLLLAGLDAKAVRHELHEFLSERKGDGSEAERGVTSRTQVVNMLMNIWVSPDLELISFRNNVLAYLREYPSMALAIHWAMLSAAYPFWFNVATQVGRLLNLQDRITQAQIFFRLKEQYGDRETVTRYCRNVVRSLVAWGVLHDSEAKGCYEKAQPLSITDQNLAILICEAALHVSSEGKCTLGVLLNTPAFFPFQLPQMSSDYISQRTNRIEVVRYGMDNDLLKLLVA